MCSVEAKRITGDLEREMHKLDKREREADECLKTSSAKLQDLIKKNDEEIQNCAHELLMLVDSVSKYKESMVPVRVFDGIQTAAVNELKYEELGSGSIAALITHGTATRDPMQQTIIELLRSVLHNFS
ncbi:hypothetical protein IFM89_024484 [Coptis chinensis]|uniref:Uncharacterized protein n=1 Tax=Coptis chinensis TaxID=261450 RepID=A0A835H8H3_9MAGN|nr:hypothetical protein IFM89_024484 [Coptis chinensis]